MHAVKEPVIILVAASIAEGSGVKQERQRVAVSFAFDLGGEVWSLE
jgi:hypothetical protein